MKWYRELYSLRRRLLISSALAPSGTGVVSTSLETHAHFFSNVLAAHPPSTFRASNSARILLLRLWSNVSWHFSLHPQTGLRSISWRGFLGCSGGDFLGRPLFRVLGGGDSSPSESLLRSSKYSKSYVGTASAFQFFGTTLAISSSHGSPKLWIPFSLLYRLMRWVIA